MRSRTLGEVGLAICPVRRMATVGTPRGRDPSDPCLPVVRRAWTLADRMDSGISLSEGGEAATIVRAGSPVEQFVGEEGVEPSRPSRDTGS